VGKMPQVQEADAPVADTNQMMSADARDHQLQKMATRELDIIVIGGGITGAGIVWDAALRGMDAGLIEMADFASGTSSRSTKLVHGGLRYLKQGAFKLVREVGAERKLLHERLPHLVEPISMLLPIYRGGTYGYYMSAIGIAIYDHLADVSHTERRRMYRRKHTIELEPLLKHEGLRGAGLYTEYRTDDARLTLEILKTAAACGANVCNYARVEDFLYKKGKAVGVHVVDMMSGERYTIYARKIVNATGPWVDDLRQLDKSLDDKRLLLTKGVHLVVPHKRLPIRQAVYFDAPDGRMIFAIPRSGKTYIGTTDTVYEGDRANPMVTREDADYLIDALNKVFSTVGLQMADVEAAWAGLRPLIYEADKSPSEISRRDEIFVSESGLISIAGGKLTGFRRMAEKVVNLVAQQLEDETGVIYPPSTTDRVKISSGVTGMGDKGMERSRVGELHQDVYSEFLERAAGRGIAADDASGLWSRYGVNADMILRYYDEDDSGERLMKAELRYCVDHEMTVSAVDFLLRRTGWMLFDRARAERLCSSVIHYMTDRFAWDDARIALEWSRLRLEWRMHTVQDGDDT